MLIPSEKLIQTNVPAVENLPGLPVLPDEMRKSQDALSDYRKEYGIKFIDVNVLVDSSYKVTDFEFILELVTMKGNLSEYRGDRVHIDKKIFPGLETDNPRIEDTLDTNATEQKKLEIQYHRCYTISAAFVHNSHSITVVYMDDLALSKNPTHKKRRSRKPKN
jgi:hypothetical protein